MRKTLAILLVTALVSLTSCTTTPGVEDYFCAGHQVGQAAANGVAMQHGLPGPFRPACDFEKAELVPMPDDPTHEEAYCTGWIVGYVEVGISHFPNDPPSQAWIEVTMEQCILGVLASGGAEAQLEALRGQG